MADASKIHRTQPRAGGMQSSPPRPESAGRSSGVPKPEMKQNTLHTSKPQPGREAGNTAPLHHADEGLDRHAPPGEGGRNGETSSEEDAAM